MKKFNLTFLPEIDFQSQNCILLVERRINQMENRITVRYGKTINMGNFEFERIDLEFSRDLKPEENKNEAMKKELNNLISFIDKIDWNCKEEKRWLR